MIKLEINILNSHKLSDQKVMQEILLAETKMNASSKIRFHISNTDKLVADIKANNNADIKLQDKNKKDHEQGWI